MIFDLVQTFTETGASYKIIRNGQLVGKAALEYDVHFFYVLSKAKINYGLCNYIMQTGAWKDKNNRGLKVKDQKFGVNDIFCDGKLVGEIGEKCLYDGRIARPPYYIFLEFENRSYKLYRVPLGKQGWRYPIYFEDEQVALIETYVVPNARDYVLHVFTGDAFDRVTTLLGIYLAKNYYCKTWSIDDTNDATSIAYMTDKDIKSKYNQDFKNQIEP